MRGSWLARQGAGTLYSGQLQANHTVKKSELLGGREYPPVSYREFQTKAIHMRSGSDACHESLPRSARKSFVFTTSHDDANVDTWFAARNIGVTARPQSARHVQYQYEAASAADSWSAFASSRKPSSNFKPSPCRDGSNSSRQADVGMPFGAEFPCGDDHDAWFNAGNYSSRSSSARYEHERLGPEIDACRALAEAELKGKEEVRRVFRQLLLKWHPDKVEERRKVEATRVFQYLSEQRLRLGLA